MLDIVFTNSGCELGMIHKFGNLQSDIQVMLSSKNTNVKSTIDGKVSQAESDIQALINAVQNMQ